MLRLAPVLAALILAGAASLALAAERVAIVGTPVSLVPPDGFAERAAPGLTNAEGVVIRAFNMPAAYLFEDGLAADEGLAPFFGLEGFVSAGAPTTFEANGELGYIEAGRLADGRPVWVAVFNASTNAALTVVVPAGQTGFTRAEVESVLASVLLAKGRELATGGAVQGVLLPLVAPFSDVDVATGIVKSVTLSLTEEKGRNRTQPHLDLFFPRQAGEGLSMADLAAKYLALDTSAGSSADATLLGATAIRQQGTSWDGSVKLVGVGYLTVIGGQTVVLFGRGPDEKMTEDIIAAVDKAAAGLMRFVPEEGEE